MGPDRIETDAVITRANQLFADAPELILGFQQFLPPDIRNRMVVDNRQAAQTQMHQSQEPPRNALQAAPEQKPGAAALTPGQCETRAMPQGTVAQPSQTATEGYERQQQAQKQTPVPAKSPEVDQARRYIKKIKERFHSDPQKYKKFLEILH